MVLQLRVQMARQLQVLTVLLHQLRVDQRRLRGVTMRQHLVRRLVLRRRVRGLRLHRVPVRGIVVMDHSTPSKERTGTCTISAWIR